MASFEFAAAATTHEFNLAQRLLGGTVSDTVKVLLLENVSEGNVANFGDLVAIAHKLRRLEYLRSR